MADSLTEQDEGNIKYGLFSATFPKAARDLAKDHLSASHVRFRVGRAGSTTENIKQTVICAERDEKREALSRILGEMHGVRTIIFTNSRQEVYSLDDFLYNMQLPVTSIHRDRTQQEREIALRSFRSGKAPILIATGVMARGIDVRNVMHVINYDLPSMDHGGIEEYTHRIGKSPYPPEHCEFTNGFSQAAPVELAIGAWPRPSFRRETSLLPVCSLVLCSRPSRTSPNSCRCMFRTAQRAKTQSSKPNPTLTPTTLLHAMARLVETLGAAARATEKTTAAAVVDGERLLLRPAPEPTAGERLLLNRLDGRCVPRDGTR